MGRFCRFLDLTFDPLRKFLLEDFRFILRRLAMDFLLWSVWGQ